MFDDMDDMTLQSLINHYELDLEPPEEYSQNFKDLSDDDYSNIFSNLQSQYSGMEVDPEHQDDYNHFMSQYRQPAKSVFNQTDEGMYGQSVAKVQQMAQEYNNKNKPQGGQENGMPMTPEMQAEMRRRQAQDMYNANKPFYSGLAAGGIQQEYFQNKLASPTDPTTGQPR